MTFLFFLLHCSIAPLLPCSLAPRLSLYLHLIFSASFAAWQTASTFTSGQCFSSNSCNTCAACGSSSMIRQRRLFTIPAFLTIRYIDYPFLPCPMYNFFRTGDQACVEHFLNLFLHGPGFSFHAHRVGHAEIQPVVFHFQ